MPRPSLGHDPERERPTVESLLRRQIVGLIAAPVAHDQSYLVPWQDRTPVVFVDRAPSGITADFVVEDDHAGAREAVDHLVGHGHHRIAFIGDSTYIATTKLRLEGYKAALVDSGLTVDPDLIRLTGVSAEEAATDAMALLAGPAAPTAIFSSNARCTMALVPALQQIGHTDIALVGFGDFPMAASLRPAVSVIDQDPRRLGQVAVERLLQRMKTPEKRMKRETILPVRLIKRASSEL